MDSKIRSDLILESGRRNLLPAVAHWTERRRTRGNPSEAREAYAVLRIWLCAKRPNFHSEAEYVGCVACMLTRRVLYSVFQKGAWSCLAQDIDVKTRRSFFCARRRSLVLGGRGKNGGKVFKN